MNLAIAIGCVVLAILVIAAVFMPPADITEEYNSRQRQTFKGVKPEGGPPGKR